MTQYKLAIVMLTHERSDCVEDNIKNFLRFNPNQTLIIISNDQGLDISHLAQDHVHIINRRPKSWCDAIVPYHIEVYDYMRSNALAADYVVAVASNQMFLRTGFYDFVQRYSAGYWARYHHFRWDPFCRCEDKLCDTFYVDDLKEENLHNLSNLDGMFFRWDVFSQMMDYFGVHFRTRYCVHMIEERLYAGYLLKNIAHEKLAEFTQYNCFNWSDCSVEQVKEAQDKNLYLIKKICRKYEDPARVYIRSIAVS